MQPNSLVSSHPYDTFHIQPHVILSEHASAHSTTIARSNHASAHCIRICAPILRYLITPLLPYEPPMHAICARRCILHPLFPMLLRSVPHLPPPPPISNDLRTHLPAAPPFPKDLARLYNCMVTAWPGVWFSGPCEFWRCCVDLGYGFNLVLTCTTSP